MTDQQPHILLVDDDPELCELLAEFLGNDGFQVSTSHSGPSALEQLNTPSEGSTPINAVVLDIMMPKMNGLEVLQSIRSQSTTPVIMLTGRGDDIDRIVGLEMGADDYLGKPCNPRELAARIRAVLRRTQPETPVMDTPLIQMHGIDLDTAQRTAMVNGEDLGLTSAEFNVLSLLMQSAGNVISKEELTEKVLNRKLSAYDRSIDVHVSRVRQKLNQALDNNNLIKTIRGAGYQLVGGE